MFNEVVPQSDVRKMSRAEKQELENLLYGQTALVAFRWVLVAAGLMLVIWNPSEMATLRVQLMGLFILAMSNFYLHTQLVMRQPTLPVVVYLTTLFDLGVISLIVMMDGGFSATAFIFYLPAIMVYSVSFPRIITAVLTFGVCFVYFQISVFSGMEMSDLPELFVRLLIFAAVSYGSGMFGLIEERRQSQVANEQQALIARLQRKS